MQSKWAAVATVLMLAGGCTAAIDSAGASPDARDAVGVSAGKADGSGFSDCELSAVVTWLNDAATTQQVVHDAGVHIRASRNLMAHRNGPDGVFGTSDDDLFDDIGEVDAVSWVGPIAMRELVAAVEDRCTGPTPPAADISAIFSPQPYDQSHLARTAQLIDGAQHTIDIAMYSFSDAKIKDALTRAVARGVSIRMVSQAASTDRTSPAGTASADLEDAGIDVRWINKIMHHKFLIIDGPRDSVDQAQTGTLATGSANWSNGGGTRFDENTLFIHGVPELLLRYQREFNYLWEHSRDLVWNHDLSYFTSMPITDADIIDDPTVDAVFTSANFRTYESSTYGWTFSLVRGNDTVADRYVQLIESAQHSIRLASAHLRSRPIAEALMAKHAADPDVDIRVYLDDQEWLSEWSENQQNHDLSSCLDAAGDNASQVQDCYTGGYMYSYDVGQAGIPVRFKYYAYRWDYSYAPQMHDKYMVIDDRFIATGSYNLSDNAEHNTMENVSIIDGAAYPDLVQAYDDNFDGMWTTGADKYQALLDEVEHGTDASFPIVFDSMALDWSQIDTLKNAIRTACPDVDSSAYRDNAASHRYCTR